MPSIKINVPHAHGQQQASERLLGFMTQMKHQYKDQVSDLQETWEENRLNYSFRTFGMTVRGAVEVQEQHVSLHADLPFAAMMFKGKIEQEIRGTLERVLG
ncbi:MAG: polyhydroxyalkanoic acid system family protein [Planctomycetes bacterium]|nr:polyhydroxyalkanoic acid system family protein [Planctomycetota bacterium]